MLSIRAYLKWWIVAIYLLSPWAFASVASITDVRASQTSGMTRIVFEINGVYRYQWKLQPGAKQLTLDLAQTLWNAPPPTSTWNGTLVKSCQSSVSGQSLRIRFQLKTAVTAKVYTLSSTNISGHRLVLEIKPLVGTNIAPDTTPDASTSISSSQASKSNQAAILLSSKPLQPVTSSIKTAIINPDVDIPPPSSSKPKAKLQDKSARPIIVVIDPGHGGKDPGATGPRNTREKDVVLAISKQIQQQFNQQPGFNALLTRSRDVFIPLRQRLAIARKCRADIFIAIHADAAYNQDAVGASVFALSERGATSEGARILAEKENESELLYGVMVNKDQVLRSVLMDLSQTHTIAVSLEMGREILQKLSNITRLHYARVEQAAFVVLKSPDIPSLLVETGYISNPSQEQKLRDPGYQQQLATAIVQGVMAYFTQHPPSRGLITT